MPWRPQQCTLPLKFEIPHSRSTSLGSSWLIWMSKIMTWLLAKQETKENISVLFWGSAKFKFNFSQDFVKISINLFNKILKFYWIQQFLLKTFSSWRPCFKILLSKVVNLDIGWFSWHVLSTVHVLPSLYTLLLYAKLHFMSWWRSNSRRTSIK